MAQGQILKDSAVCTAQHPFFFFSRVVFEKCEKKRQQEKVMERW